MNKRIAARWVSADETLVGGEVVSTTYSYYAPYVKSTPFGLMVVWDDCVTILKNERAFSDPPLCIDLFAGAGGASLGLQHAGFRTVGVEVEKYAALTYQRNLDNCIRADCRYLPIRPYLEPDLVWSSAPCQDYTTLNVRRNRPEVKNSPRAYLVVVSAIQMRLLHPKTVIMENVPGARKSWQWAAAEEILRDGGYDVRTDLLDAANYGVPQYRNRAILLGSRVSKAPMPPRPTHGRDKDIIEGLAEGPASGAHKAARSFITVENEWMNWEAENWDADSPVDKLVKEVYVRLGVVDHDPEEKVRRELDDITETLKNERRRRRR